MTRLELDTVDAAARAIFPKNAHAELTVGAEDLEVRRYFAELIARSSTRVAFALRLGILFCMLSPLFVLRRFATLRSLDVSDRQKAIEALAYSPIYAVRQLVLLIKVHVAMVFGAHPIARAVMMPEPEKVAAPLVSNLVKGERRAHVA
ncbi:MAG: hypothetical protein ACRELY_07225 [Polyangiaceae bacterium]